MNKLAIPALLVATVMVAGAFAFMPVEQASTVHTSAELAGANVLRTETVLDLTLSTKTGSGAVTFSTSDGLFQIKQLLLCSFSGDGEVRFAVNTENFSIGTGNLVDEDGDWFDFELPNGPEAGCADVFPSATDDETSAGQIQLRGDSNNDVVLLFREYSGDPDDTATLISYVSGVSTALDIDVNFGDE